MPKTIECLRGGLKEAILSKLISEKEFYFMFIFILYFMFYFGHTKFRDKRGSKAVLPVSKKCRTSDLWIDLYKHTVTFFCYSFLKSILMMWLMPGFEQADISAHSVNL